MVRLFCIWVAVLSALLVPADAWGLTDGERLEKELENLKLVVDDYRIYLAQQTRQVDSIRTLLKATPHEDLSRRIRLSMNLASAVVEINADSAIAYSRKAVELANELGSHEAIIYSNLNLLSSLVSDGLHMESYKVFESMKDMEMSESMKIDYWTEGKRLYARVDQAIVDGNVYKSKYIEISNCLTDSLLAALPRDDAYHRYLWGEKMYYEGKYKESEDILLRLLKDVNPDTKMASEIYQLLAQNARQLHSEELYAYYLCLAAENNIKNWNTGTTVIPDLGNWLASNGRQSVAYNILFFYLSNTHLANSRSLPLSVVSSLPELEKNYTKSLRMVNAWLWVMTVVAFLLLVVSVILLMKFYRDRNRFRRMTDILEQQSRLQSSYMGSFIELCTIYAERLESLRTMAVRKIKAGKSEDLVNMMKSGKGSDPKMEDFYKIFDTAFLELYPSFIESVNALLRPDQRFPVTADKVLPAELRIYALVRMGISEGTKISKILNYSSNTIYSYRNKLRNKAISRDTFDEDVMKIDIKRMEK